MAAKPADIDVKRNYVTITIVIIANELYLFLLPCHTKLFLSF